MSGFKRLVDLFDLFVCSRVEKSLFPLLAALSMLLVPTDLSAQNESPKPGKPVWISSSNLSSDTGYGQLEWDLTPGMVVEMFQLREKFNGTTSYSYVSGRKLDIYRAIPGHYEF